MECHSDVNPMSHQVVPWYTSSMTDYEKIGPVHELVKSTLQLCFCGEGHTALPVEPLNVHNPGCLVWDWALTQKKITAKGRMLQLDHHAKTIGDPGGETEADSGGRTRNQVPETS
jgi:hypothetical protein